MDISPDFANVERDGQPAQVGPLRGWAVGDEISRESSANARRLTAVSGTSQLDTPGCPHRRAGARAKCAEGDEIIRPAP